MYVNKERVITDPILKQYIPVINILIVDYVTLHTKLMAYCAVKHPRRSTSIAIKATANKQGLLNPKIIYENKEMNPKRVLDAVFGVPDEDYVHVIETLLETVFDMLKEYDGYDVQKVMLDILSWDSKMDTPKNREKLTIASKTSSE